MEHLCNLEKKTMKGLTQPMGKLTKLFGDYIHPQKSNIDTKHDGFLDVSPFKHGCFGYPR